MASPLCTLMLRTINLRLLVALSLLSLVNSINIWPRSVFPVELGETVTWIFKPRGGEEFTDKSMISFEISGGKNFAVQSTRCTGPSAKYFSCSHKPGNDITVSFTPTEIFFGGDLVIKFYKNMDSVWTGSGTVLFHERIMVTKQPTFIEMLMYLKEPSRFTSVVPTGLRLEPPVFLTGSTVRIECKTDGSLPPVPIRFSVECPPAPTAAVEHDRVTQAKQGLPYEKFYRSYGFHSVPTMSDLASYVAKKRADSIIQQGHVSTKDNKTLRAMLTMNEKAHDCHVVCRIAGKETRRQLTVFYPTTISYLLPHPRNGYINVGSEVTCYADGHPPPMISLRLSQPLRPPKPLTEDELETLRQIGRLPRLNGEDPVTRELLLKEMGLELIPKQIEPPPAVQNKEQQLASSGVLKQSPPATHRHWFIGEAKEPYEVQDGIPGIGLSAVERHRQLGLHPNEYSIQGATFRLAPNATPGVELLLTCTARNVLPGDTTFLGLNGTIARSRFVISAISYTSLGVSIGVCAFILLILLIIILAMFLQRRNQAREGTDQQRLAPNGMKKARPPTKAAYTKGQMAPRAPPPTGFNSTAHRPQYGFPNADFPSASNLAPNTYTTDPHYRYGSTNNLGSHPEFPQVATPVQQQQHQQQPIGPEDLQYVELSFDHHQQPSSSTAAAAAVPPNNNNQRPALIRGGPTSASMTLFGTQPRTSPAQPPHGVSVPHSLNTAAASWQPEHPTRPEDTSSHYTEIVAFMQPKAHSSQLVLQQQQEATQALLAMQQNKPRVFV